VRGAGKNRSAHLVLPGPVAHVSRRLAKGYIVGRIQDEPGSKPQCWVWDRLAGKCQGLYIRT